MSGPGQINFGSLMQLWSQCKITGGRPKLGITNVFGFKAIAIALDAYRRDISNTKHDITWDALEFNGTQIYSDPAGSVRRCSILHPAVSTNAGASGNTSRLVDGVGSNTTTVAYTDAAVL